MSRKPFLLGLVSALVAAQAAWAVPPESVLNNEATSLMIKGNLEVAEQRYRQALKINPKYNYGLENLAMCLNNQGLKTKPAQSAQLFHQALYIHDTPTVRANLKECLKSLGFDDTKFDDRRKFAERCLASGDTIGAIIEYEAALKIKDDAAIRTKLASLKAPAGTPLRMKDLHLKPTSVESAQEKVQGALLMQEIQQKSAEHWRPKKSESSRHTIVDFVVNTDGSVSKLKVYQSSGDSALDESALTAIRSAAPFKHIPKVPKGQSVDIRFSFDYNAWSSSSVAEKNIDRAKARVAEMQKESGATATNTITALLNLGQEYRNTGRYTEAVQTFDETLARLPDDGALRAQIDFEKGRTYYESGKLHESEGALKSAIGYFDAHKAESGTLRIEAMEMYGKVLYKQSRVPEAEKYLTLVRQEKSRK